MERSNVLRLTAAHSGARVCDPQQRTHLPFPEISLGNRSNHHFRAALLAPLLLAFALPAGAADAPVALKDAFKDHFLIGTGQPQHGYGRHRFSPQRGKNAADVALLKQQFNQITAENGTKRQLIHPREGADGYHQ